MYEWETPVIKKQFQSTGGQREFNYANSPHVFGV
jgi:hypothetical protein